MEPYPTYQAQSERSALYSVFTRGGGEGPPVGVRAPVRGGDVHLEPDLVRQPLLRHRLVQVAQDLFRRGDGRARPPDLPRKPDEYKLFSALSRYV